MRLQMNKGHLQETYPHMYVFMQCGSGESGIRWWEEFSCALTKIPFTKENTGEDCRTDRHISY